jgi:PAS domain-containing protein
MDESVKLLLVVGSSICAIFLAGWGANKLLYKYFLTPLNKAIETIGGMTKDYEKMKAENHALSTLQDNNSPIVQKIIETHKMVEHMGIVQETKFELENQAFFECDSSGYLVKANDAFYKLAHINKEDDIAHQWISIISDTFQDRFLEQWSRLVNSGISINEEVPAKNGGKFIITARRKPANTPEARVIMGSIGLVVGG